MWHLAQKHDPVHKLWLEARVAVVQRMSTRCTGKCPTYSAHLTGSTLTCPVQDYKGQVKVMTWLMFQGLVA